MKKALVTGINGFAASWLSEELLRRGWDVHGTLRPRSNPRNIAHIFDRLNTSWCEMTDYFSVRETIKRVQPDSIFHLAAQSFVPLSWKAPHLTFETNVGGTINVLEACRELEKNPSILITSSSQVYGNAEVPFGLNTLYNPVNPYDVSKLAQELIGKVYFKSYGLRVRTTRAFNITGPRRQEFMAESSFAKQIAEIEKGKRSEISLGNLEATRDFIDVRDVARGYADVIEKGNDGETYILASGKETKMSEVLNILIGLSTKSDIKVVQDPNLMRPSDTPRMRGDTSSADAIGWKAEISLEQSLNDLLEYWRERV